MPFRYKVLPEHRLLFGVFYGTLTAAEYMDGVDELSRDPAFEPDYDRLGIFLDGLDLSRIGLEEIRAVKERMVARYYDGTVPESLSYRIAVVSKPSVNETTLKLYAATLTASLLSDISVKVLPDLGKALGWLGRENLVGEFRKPAWIDFMAVEP